MSEDRMTAAGLRRMLFEEIQALRDGRRDPSTSKQIASMATVVLKSVEVEMAFRAQQEELKGVDDIGEMPLSELPTQPQTTIGVPRIIRGKAQSGSA